jgi:hypothetical protein
VSHNYAGFVDPSKAQTVAQVTLRIDGERLEVAKTIIIMNPSVLTRKKGYIQLLSSTSRRLRRQSSGVLVGDFVISNIEPEPITFSHAREELAFCDPRRGSTSRDTPLDTIFQAVAGRQPSPRAGPRPQPPRGTGVLAARESIEGRLSLDESRFAGDICGVTFRLFGQAERGLRVFASLHFQVRANPYLTRPVNDSATRAFLAELVQKRLVSDAQMISLEDLYRLEREGKISRGPKGWEVLR